MYILGLSGVAPQFYGGGMISPQSMFGVPGVSIAGLQPAGAGPQISLAGLEPAAAPGTQGAAANLPILVPQSSVSPEARLNVLATNGAMRGAVTAVSQYVLQQLQASPLSDPQAMNEVQALLNRTLDFVNAGDLQKAWTQVNQAYQAFETARARAAQPR